MEQQLSTEKRKQQLRRLLVLWIVFFLFAALLVLVILELNRRNKEMGRGLPMQGTGFLPETMEFRDGDSSIGEMVQENYMNYLHMAYILIGRYPDCQFIKISDKVERNTYDWEKDFYVPEGEAYVNYFPDGVRSGRLGIDVSEFQGDIDWEQVADAGIEIAIIRVGYRGYGSSGTLMEDTMYEKNIREAAAAGIEVGVYFYSQAVNREEGEEEARFVLSRIRDLPVEGPVVCDTEQVDGVQDARGNVISVDERTDAVLGFVETVEAAGYDPMIYASRNWFVLDLDMERIGSYPFWLACYETPIFPYHTEAWQYLPTGGMPGVPGNTDLDVWMD